MPKRLVIISGAGLSVESGVRAFRTDTASGRSMWDEYDIGEVCDLRAFRAGFEKYTGSEVKAHWLYENDKGVDLYTLTNEFYNKRREELGTVEPNLAHCRIAEWANRFPGQVINLTTNVDNLLERAGVKSDILHIHGYLPEVITQDSPGDPRRIIDVGYSAVDVSEHFFVKPNIVFFYENAPAYTEMYHVLDNLTVQDMVVVVGCSNLVINFWSELIPKARRFGLQVHEVNPHGLYHEEQIIKEAGGKIWRKGAGDVFSDPEFCEIIEKHLEG